VLDIYFQTQRLVNLNEMADSFYLTLPSNVAGNNGKNVQRNFRTELPQTLDLSGEWEVGIAQPNLLRTSMHVKI